MLRNNFRDVDYSPTADSISYREVFERTDSVSHYISRRCVPANQINRDLTFDGVIASDGSYPGSHRHVDQYDVTTRCLCGCNYFHLRRRSLVQSFLRKDVPPLKLLEANSFPRGNFCEASRVAPLPSLSSPLIPSFLSLLGYSYTRHAFAERA